MSMDFAYRTDGVAELLKGATIERLVESAPDEDGICWPELHIALPERRTFNERTNVTGMVISVMRDPEGNGPGALGVERIYWEVE